MNTTDVSGYGFLTPDPYPKNFYISKSNPYPKILETYYPISTGIRIRHRVNTKQKHAVIVGTQSITNITCCVLTIGINA